jgi:O-antigen/teichoic acid export membrane protein
VTPTQARLLHAGVLNLLVRVLTMPGKLVLLLVLASYLDPAEVGLYGLFVATASLAVYMLGLDFYAFSTRELAAASDAERCDRVRDQFVLYGVMYLVAVPAWLGVFGSGALPWHVAPWFGALVSMEHVSQELYRVLVALGRTVQASLVLLVRSGLWVYGVWAAMYWSADWRSLTVVWVGWVIGDAASLGLAALFLADLPWSRVGPVDWTWARRGLPVGLRFFAGSLAIRGIAVADRYLLEWFWERATVGAYTFHASMANGVQVLAETGVAALLYPQILAAWRRGEVESYRANLGQLGKALCLLLLLVVPMAVLMMELALPWLGRPVYASHRSTYWLLLASAAIAVMGLVPHYSLYARGRDLAMTMSALAGLGIMIVLGLWLVPWLGAPGAALGVLAANVGITVWKAVACWLDNRLPPAASTTKTPGRRAAPLS